MEVIHESNSVSRNVFTTRGKTMVLACVNIVWRLGNYSSDKLILKCKSHILCYCKKLLYYNQHYVFHKIKLNLGNKNIYTTSKLYNLNLALNI